MLTIVLNILISLATVAVSVVASGRLRWKRLTHARLRALRATSSTAPVAPFRLADLDDLPAPVRRYLSTVLVDGQSMVRWAHIRHTGQFRMSAAPTGWRPFRSRQWVTVRPPGMLWDAKIQMNPALTTHVHDAFIDEDGLLHAALLGLVTVARRSGSAPLAEAELMRYLAEAVWYPTALLPACGVRWDAIDASSARARLTHADTSVELEFGFGEDGLVTSVYAPARYRGEKNGQPQARPWHGRFRSYGEWGGMRIPVEGEVSWDMDGQEVAYWRGRIQAVEFGYGA